MDLQLEEAGFGILCLTPENLNAPWVMFEAGALFKKGGASRICPYLFGFEPRELTGPLVRFQAARADEAGTRRLLAAMNDALGELQLPESVLDRVFAKWWPDLEVSLSLVPKAFQELHNRIVPNPPESAEPTSTQPDMQHDTRRYVLEQFMRDIFAVPIPVAGEPPSKADHQQYVFIVHGHALFQMEEVARLIDTLGAHAIAVQDQPSRGLTVIEKLEAYSDVGFVVVIMTGDDVGGRAGRASENVRPRARQNVVLELGYFLAKLGRTRVSVLHEADVDIPSDYAGVPCIRLDPEGAWRFALAQILKAAGIKIDLNRLFEP